MVYSNKPRPWGYEWETPEVEHEPYPGYFRISFGNEVKHFVDCIVEDKEPEVPGEEGKAAVEMVLMGYLSAKTGEIVKRSDLYSSMARKHGIK